MMLKFNQKEYTYSHPEVRTHGDDSRAKHSSHLPSPPPHLHLTTGACYDTTVIYVHTYIHTYIHVTHHPMLPLLESICRNAPHGQPVWLTRHAPALVSPSPVPRQTAADPKGQTAAVPDIPSVGPLAVSYLTAQPATCRRGGGSNNKGLSTVHYTWIGTHRATPIFLHTYIRKHAYTIVNKACIHNSE